MDDIDPPDRMYRTGDLAKNRDRMALAARSRRDRPDLYSRYREPAGDIERWLAELWQEFLDIDAIGADDDFIELGGHSILATSIISEINAAFNLFITARAFYENPTIAEMAAHVAGVLANGGHRMPTNLRGG
jgi:hypothetical protein